MTTAYVMVGAPGAGKSTYAAVLAEIENAVVISGDAVREDLFGPDPSQGNWVDIWDTVEERVSECCGMNIIIDGTHCRLDYRQETVALLRSYGYERVEAVILDVSLATALARNFTRDRHVPDYIVKVMHKDLQRSLKNIYNEDFDHLTFRY